MMLMLKPWRISKKGGGANHSNADAAANSIATTEVLNEIRKNDRIADDEKLVNKVMKYIQKYDQQISNRGYQNKRRKEIDFTTLAKLLNSKKAMDGLISIIRIHVTEVRQQSNELRRLEEETISMTSMSLDDDDDFN